MREYAPFFEWFAKDRKELGVVEELVASLNRETGANLRAVRIQKLDPPDCVCSNAAGDSVAIEVAEVVSEEAARLTAQGNSVMRVWHPGELATHIGQLLAAKDQKTYHGGPYVGIAVALFTDEPMLTFEQATSELRAASFGPYSQVTSAYLLLSYDPHTRSYPVISLAMTR